MLRIKKVLFFKIIPLMVSILFLFNNSVYASPRLSTKQCLRLPLGNYKRMLDIQLDTEGFRELKELSEKRLAHVKKVIEMFYSLVDGDFRNIYNALQEPVRISIDFEKQYKPLLEGLKKRYDGLSKEDREALKLATILHDVGVPGGKAWEHNKRGAIKARDILQDRGVDQEMIEKVTRLIEYHGGFSNLWTDGFPQDLLALQENEFNGTLLINIFDAMGRLTQDLKSNNAVTPDILELYLSFKDTLRDYQTKGNFYKDRFRFLLSPAIFKQLHINKNVYSEMESYIEGSIPKEEQKDFYGNWNNRLRVYVFPLFAQIGKDSIKDFVKFVRLISQIATVSLELSPQLKDLIVDTRLDIMAENMDEGVKKSYISKIAELAHNIPGDYEFSKVRSAIKPGYISNIFGIRIDLTDKNRMVIDVEDLDPKITPPQLYEELLEQKSSLASNETILNSKGESFDDIWEWLREQKLTYGERIYDPRRLSILPGEKEFAEAYAKMSLEDLQDDVLVDLINSGMIEGCGWMLKKRDPLQTFIDSLNTVDYDITIHRIKSAESRVQTSKGDIENSKKRGNYNNKKKKSLNEKLLNSYRYRAFLRELTKRWRKPKEDFSLLGIISKPGLADTSL